MIFLKTATHFFGSSSNAPNSRRLACAGPKFHRSRQKLKGNNQGVSSFANASFATVLKTPTASVHLRLGAEWQGFLMLGRLSFMLLLAAASLSLLGDAAAGERGNNDAEIVAPLVEASPTLAPFQHVRFCLRYPGDCQPNSRGDERILLNSRAKGLLTSVNSKINHSIAPGWKNYQGDVPAAWAIAPTLGDCNDYAVTKRHELLMSGLPSSALRLSVVKTPKETGHLVLVVVTTAGNLVMDNLNGSIRPWQSTDYHWIKIQSAKDPRFWTELKSPDH
jgi:predicted transglutaminase-like cysteine proteinase